MLPAQSPAGGAAVTSMVWLSVAVPVLVQVTVIETVRPVPTVLPVIVIVDDPLNPVPTLHA